LVSPESSPYARSRAARRSFSGSDVAWCGGGNGGPRSEGDVAGGGDGGWPFASDFGFVFSFVGPKPSGADGNAGSLSSLWWAMSAACESLWG
jgi:hypothetical protein